MKEVEDDEVLISACFSNSDPLTCSLPLVLNLQAFNKTDGRLKQFDAVVDLGFYHVCFYCFFVECQLPGLARNRFLDD